MLAMSKYLSLNPKIIDIKNEINQVLTEILNISPCPILIFSLNSVWITNFLSLFSQYTQYTQYKIYLTTYTHGNINLVFFLI